MWFCAAKQVCISSSKTDAAAEENQDVTFSQQPTSNSCDVAVPSHHKFVWPGIDAVIEAYASHVEGDNSLLCF